MFEISKERCIWCKKFFKNYQNRNRKRCAACNTKIRRFRAKLAAIELLGGKCNRCAFDSHPSALEFHHKDGDKEFAIGMAANKSWGSIVDEIRKCELLCSNCHRIEHSERYEKDFIGMALSYKGLETFGGMFQKALERPSVRKFLGLEVD